MSIDALIFSLKDKNVIIISDDYIPYEYILKFASNLYDSKIWILSYPEHLYRYTKINFKKAGILNTKILLKNKIFKIDKSNFAIILFFGKKNNDDKKWLLSFYRKFLLNDYELITLTEDGVEYDEDSPLFRQ
jgi:hypothetical protein